MAKHSTLLAALAGIGPGANVTGARGSPSSDVEVAGAKNRDGDPGNGVEAEGESEDSNVSGILRTEVRIARPVVRSAARSAGVEPILQTCSHHTRDGPCRTDDTVVDGRITGAVVLVVGCVLRGTSIRECVSESSRAGPITSRDGAVGWGCDDDWRVQSP